MRADQVQGRSGCSASLSESLLSRALKFRLPPVAAAAAAAFAAAASPMGAGRAPLESGLVGFSGGVVPPLFLPPPWSRVTIFLGLEG